MSENHADDTVDVPARLYAQARRRLLENEPLRDQADASHPVALSLTAGEVAAAQAVGLATTPWVGDSSEDPVMYSVTDYMALVETSLTVAEVADVLKVDVTRIRQRLRERSLYGIEYDGEQRLPRFQFERGLVLPGLREVLAVLPEARNPLDVAQWFLAKNPDLEVSAVALSPRDWLLRGESVAAAVALARGFE
jgi:hypothetical protein